MMRWDTGGIAEIILIGCPLRPRWWPERSILEVPTNNFRLRACNIEGSNMVSSTQTGLCVLVLPTARILSTLVLMASRCAVHDRWFAFYIIFRRFTVCRAKPSSLLLRLPNLLNLCWTCWVGSSTHERVVCKTADCEFFFKSCPPIVLYTDGAVDQRVATAGALLHIPGQPHQWFQLEVPESVHQSWRESGTKFAVITYMQSELYQWKAEVENHDITGMHFIDSLVVKAFLTKGNSSNTVAIAWFLLTDSNPSDAQSRLVGDSLAEWWVGVRVAPVVPPP
eukprot:2480545-Amphidinium_carterae.3